ncbi:hypothetical protein [Bradyrhizobium sp. Ec3.3]|uniref:hypothetical protein n=1 Tax=Bradyrhizobium sp. Ec3.3 TaxID=189753 RepID=UPI000414965F|nr:hypothetical protein [Bradyrhizobium sp. Ec3.3]
MHQTIDIKRVPAQLGGKTDWDWVDREIAPSTARRAGRGIERRFVIGLLLKHLSTCPTRASASSGAAQPIEP